MDRSGRPVAEPFDPTDDAQCNLILQDKDRDAQVIFDCFTPGIWGWSLRWKHGTASFGYKAKEEIYAHRTAALFIYLWERGIDPCLANELARLYMNATR